MRDIATKQGDLVIANGDFFVNEAASQHVEHLLIARKGQYKNSPISGVGIGDMLGAPLSPVRRAAMRRDIKLQLMSEGMKNVSVEVSDTGDISINGAQ